ncbi:MAG: LCP family protein [Eubacterium sp.]|nr:LCP family protein [Eubacterium sp.]
MDFNDKRFGGQENNKDRTVPPEENYYANRGFDLDKYKQNSSYGREEDLFSSQNRYNFDSNDKDSFQERELTPSEEFFRNFNTAFSEERRTEQNNPYDYGFNREVSPTESYSNQFDNRDRYVPSENTYYSSYDRRQAVDAFSQTRDRDRSNRYNDFDRNSRYSDFDRRSRFDDTDRQSRYSERDRRVAPEDIPPKKKSKRKKNKLKPIIAALSILLAIVILLTATGFTALLRINYNEKSENRYVSSENLKSSPDVTNILLLGVDARATEESSASRSDTMMLVSIDSAHNCIKMVSFLRDSWVYIPCKDTWQRLNAACSYGGYSAVSDTIEYNFGIKIDGYVVADFEMFKVMVDRLGGVKIEVSEKEAKEVTSHPKRYGNVELEAGKHKLSGEQALAYCRIRKIDTDWVRTERQRTVMQAILKKAATHPISDIRMLSKIAPYIDTNLSKSEIMGLASKILGNVSGGFKQESCPFDGTWEYANRGGASVIALNIERNKEKIAEFIYE